MKSILLRSYPRDWKISFLHILKVNAFIGLFVTFFLFLFKPSSIICLHVDFSLYQCCIYGIISFLVATIIMKYTPILFPNFSTEENWNIGKEFLLNFSIMFFITIAIIVYGIIILGVDFELEIALRILWLATLIGAVPIFGIILYNQNRLLKNYIDSSKEINNLLLNKTTEKPVMNASIIEIIGEGKNESLELNVSQFLYASSQSNYCEIYYLKDSKLERQLIRISLSNLFNYFSNYDYIEKVHRSYIGNLLKVSNVSGNAQGYKLHYEGLQNTVPVSRSLSKEIKNKIIVR